MSARKIAGLHALIPVLLIFAIGITGCTDGLSPVDSDDDSLFESAAPAEDDKFRHAALMERALTKAGGKYGDTEALTLVVGTSGTVGTQRVLERMKVLERYKVLERFTYDLIFKGIAISIIDEEGGEEYAAALDLLRQDPDVVWFEPAFSVFTRPEAVTGSNPHQLVPWSVALIGGRESVAESGNGSGSTPIDVYVLDTGVNDHDLNIVESHYFGENGSDASDDDGHGTHVGVIIGGEDDADGLVGVAPGSRIHNFKVLDNGYGDISVVLNAIETIIADYRANARPTVVNMSIGEYIGTSAYTSLDFAVEQAIDEGIVVVASAGNHGLDASHATPAHVAGAITVGSFDMNGTFSNFSNYGAVVDILAPGQNIISLDDKGRIRSMDGTSMAAAHVTGAAALYLSQYPKASPAQVQAALIANAKSVVGGTPGNTTDRTVWVGQPEGTPVFSTAPTPGTDIVAPKRVTDEFAQISFNGGGGVWEGDWSEDGETDGAVTGLVLIKSFGSTRCGDDGTCMALGANYYRANERTVTRAANLSSPFDPVASFDYYRFRGYGLGSVELQVSKNHGNTWETMRTYNFADGESTGREEVALPGYNKTGFQVRFRLVPDGYSRVSGGLFVDNFEINY